MTRDDKCYELILTYFCNARCVFCSQEDNLKNRKDFDLDTRKVLESIKNAKRDGYNKIGFTGGEPLLRKDILLLIKFAKKTGFDYIRIQTNGFLLSDYSFVEKLVESGVSFFKLSIHSHKNHVNDYLMGHKGALKKSLAAIDNINKAEARLSIGLVINKLNFKYLEEYVKYFSEKKDVSEFVFLLPTYIANMEKNLNKLSVPHEKVIPYLKKAYSYLDERGLHDYLFLNIPPCYIPEKAQKIVGLSKFNTLVNSVIGEWDLDDNTNISTTHLPECDICTYNKKCSGLSKKYIELFSKTKVTPILKVIKNNPKTNFKGKQILFSNGEKCLIKILRTKKKATTSEILLLAKNIPLCMDCDNGVSVVNAAESLVEKKVIKKHFLRGKYYWSLI